MVVPRKAAMKTKQVIVMRKDLNMRKGKMIAQGAHASMKVLLDLGKIYRETSNIDGDLIDVHFTANLWYHDRFPFTGVHDERKHDALIEWLEGSFTKVCVSVNSEAELLEVYQKAKDAGLLCSLIIDNGLTEFGGVKTPTCCAIGPEESSKIDEITGKLSLL